MFWTDSLYLHALRGEIYLLAPWFWTAYKWIIYFLIILKIKSRLSLFILWDASLVCSLDLRGDSLSQFNKKSNNHKKFSDNTEGKAFICLTYRVPSPSFPYGPSNLTGLISEIKAWSHNWVLLGVAHKGKKKKFILTTILISCTWAKKKKLSKWQYRELKGAI